MIHIKKVCIYLEFEHHGAHELMITKFQGKKKKIQGPASKSLSAKTKMCQVNCATKAKPKDNSSFGVLSEY